MRTPEGRTTGVQGALQDISRRKENEAKTRHLTEQLQNTLESITDAVFTLDRQWRFLYLNSEAARQLGRPRDALIGREIWTEFPEAVGTTLETQSRRALELEKTVEFEEFFPPRRAWFSVRAYPSEHGLTVYFQNITRQRQAREEARTSEERFRLLARATNDAIWDWDVTTNVLWWNEGFETLFGYRREDDGLTTRSWTSRVHPDERPRVIASLEKALTDGHDTWSAEYRFRRSDGCYAVVLDRGYIIRDPDGTPVRMIGGMTDVTERRRLEAQFLRTQRLESIGTLAGGIAHDLNNVLTPIVMSVAMLKEDETDPLRLEMLNSIEASAQRGASMVRQVLTFARGVAGNAEPVNPRDLVRDIQKIIRDTFPKDIDVAVEAPVDIWLVQADATQLHQVLMNLCLNARDAMPEGGSLLVSARNVLFDDGGRGSGPAQADGPYVRLTVEDTGTGMPREVQERAFEPFFTTKEVGKGTGLGLSTALTIVRSHGGFIDVQSEAGKGTRVNVYIPVQEATIVRNEEFETSRRAAVGDGELVLVVDDEDQIRASTCRMLERYGYRVMVAANGAEGIASYLQHQADIAAVITDMAMPVMDGAEMIQTLKKMEPEVKIIASSGHAMNEAVDKALAAGVQHFIPKPYSAEAILSALQELLGKR
jgi:PAS domain S-box-containing protein